MTDLCFIIPTYNRFEKIILTINQIEKVLLNSNIDYKVLIVDNSSNNKTFDHFNKNQSTRISYLKRKNSISNGNLSIHQSLLDVNIDSKWYWWLGDDDYILPESVEVLRHCLSHPEINYLHATDATHTLANLNIVDTGENILRHFGILELTSFISSQIFTKKILLRLKNKIETNFNNFNWEFNFNHSFVISETIWQETCLVSKAGMVLAQNHLYKQEGSHPTPSAFYDSLRGWFNISDFIDQFFENVGLQHPVDQRVFFYQGQPIWNAYLIWILTFLSIDTKQVVKEDLNKILELIRKSDQHSNFRIALIQSVFEIENLRSYADVEFSEHVIVPFYRNALSLLRS